MEEEKKRLRRYFSARRNALSSEERAVYDAALRKNLCALDLFCSSACTAAFMPLGAEPDLLPVLREKRLFLPRYAAEKQTYELVEVFCLERDLVTGRYGIAEPRPEMPAAEEDFIRNEVLFLVPAVSCDRRGTRLGRGGGFYDRLLEAVAKPPVGVIYSCQTGEDLPKGRYDVPMGWVVTEKEVINCQREGEPLPDKE